MNELLNVSNEEIVKCKQSQREYASRNGAPHFAPSDGVCWNCNRNIYQNYEIPGIQGNKVSNGYSLDRAGTTLITGCPHCNRSYCD